MRLLPELVIMAKRPVAGAVKTRLARDIGTTEALRFYRQQLAATFRDLARDQRWQTRLALAPDHDHCSHGLGHCAIIGQGTGDIGQRMQSLFEQAARRGPLIIIGADIPGIAPQMIARAFHALESHDCVFGPASDGGFWLMGQRRRPRILRPFVHIRWSSCHALADVRANLPDGSTVLVDELNDIDTGADLMT